MTYNLNPIVRWQLCRNTYRLTREFGRGRWFSAAMGLSMLLFGRTPRHRIRPGPSDQSH